MLTQEQVDELVAMGVHRYNHNLETARSYFANVVTTHTWEERWDTLTMIRAAGMEVCCGGIVGMGETRAQRAALIAELANMDPPPESVPINHLVQVDGTPLAGLDPLDPIEFVRTIAAARITMPTSMVRLSAGRQQMGEAVQALCFLAGANSIFYGDKLLTTGNPDTQADLDLLARLGLKQGQPIPIA